MLAIWSVICINGSNLENKNDFYQELLESIWVCIIYYHSFRQQHTRTRAIKGKVKYFKYFKAPTHSARSIGNVDVAFWKNLTLQNVSDIPGFTPWMAEVCARLYKVISLHTF